MAIASNTEMRMPALCHTATACARVIFGVDKGWVFLKQKAVLWCENNNLVWSTSVADLDRC
jgi:hypothetical protein